MKDDRFTNTPVDAAAYEQYRAGEDYKEPRPTKAELDRDEADELGLQVFMDPEDDEQDDWVEP